MLGHARLNHVVFSSPAACTTCFSKPELLRLRGVAVGHVAGEVLEPFGVSRFCRVVQVVVN